MSMKKLSLKSLVWKEGKYYVSHALNFDLSSFGKTRREALKNLVEALELYLEDSPKIEAREVTRPTIMKNIVMYA